MIHSTFCRFCKEIFEILEKKSISKREYLIFGNKYVGGWNRLPPTAKNPV